MSEPKLTLGNLGTCSNPWSNIITCPVTIYTILVVLGVIWIIYGLVKAPNVDVNGQPVSNAKKWGFGLLGLLIFILIAYAFGKWMYGQCEKCSFGSAWLIFLLAIFFPIILSLIVGVVLGTALGISTFTWGNKMVTAPEVINTNANGNTNPVLVL